MGSVISHIVYAAIWPISIPITKVFELDTVFYVNFTTMLQMINAVPMTFASIYLYSRFGVSVGLRLIVTVALLGTVLRASCYFYESFWPVAIGQVLCSCSNAFY